MISSSISMISSSMITISTLSSILVIIIVLIMLFLDNILDTFIQNNLLTDFNSTNQLIANKMYDF